MAAFGGMDKIQASNIIEALGVLDDPPPWLSMVVSAVRYQRYACGQSVWPAESLRTLVERKAALHRAYSYRRPMGIPVTSIHGAKNRQFRHVIVLWPHAVHGDAIQQRRLLYNAITRAQESCAVFVRGRDLLNAPPFS
jgi:superfamily I DNA/RNA helicase